MYKNPITSIKEAIDYLQAPERLKENIDLVSGLINVQREVLDMQERNQKLQASLGNLKQENDILKELKKYNFAPDKNYLIDPDDSGRRFCPLCTKKHMTPVPLNGVYCVQCKGQYAR